MVKAIIADGGIKYSGDIVKSLSCRRPCCNARKYVSWVQMNLQANLKFIKAVVSKTYRGMGSLGAMEKGSSDRYFQGSVNEANKLVPEGIEGRVAYKGSVSDIVFQLIGGLKSGMGYVGASRPESVA